MLQTAKLNAPCPAYTTYGGIPLTEFMKLTYLARGDLTQRFSLENKFDRTVYLLWFLLYTNSLYGFSENWFIEPSWKTLEERSPEYGYFEQAPLTNLQAALWFAHPLPKVFDLHNPQDRLKIEMLVACWKHRHPSMPKVKISAAAKLLAKEPQPEIINDTTIPISVLMHTIWSIRADLQTAFPLDNPAGRQGLLDWFETHAQLEHDLSQFCDQFKISSFEQTSNHQPLSHQSSSPQLASSLTEKFGMNIVGSAIGTSGMAKQGQMTLLAANAVNLPVCLLDHGNIGPNDIDRIRCLPNLVTNSPKYFVNVGTHNIDLIPSYINKVSQFLDNSYHIYYGNWEYSEYPLISQEIVNHFDEVWAPSQFTYQTLSKVIKPRVTHMPMAVTVAPGQNHERAFFHLPDNHFLFLFTFDYWSWLDRKNPLACIKAFKLAFPKGTEPAGLIIKTKNVRLTTYSTGEAWNSLKELAQTDKRITIIEDGYSDMIFYDLMRVCDAYISLHRAEGFGFSIAEAMLLGKPVIVTNYSANQEFTLESNSCLVDYKLVSVPPNNVFNICSHWADPDIENAAWYMRRLYNDSAYAKHIGQAGQNFIEKHYNLKTVGEQIKNRISQIYNDTKRLQDT